MKYTKVLFAFILQVYIGNLIYNPGNVVYKRDDGDKKGVNVVVVVLAAVLAMVVTVVIIVGQLSEIPSNASVCGSMYCIHACMNE